MPIINRISEFHEKMIEWRQDIHSHPELAYQEKRTANKVAELLREFGVDEITFLKDNTTTNMKYRTKTESG